MRLKGTILFFFLLLLKSGWSQQYIQGTIKAGTNDSIEVWIRPTFNNSTAYLFQIGMPIAFPSAASPMPTALPVTTVNLSPQFKAVFGSNYSVTVNPIATATGGAEKYFNVVLVRGGAGASNPQIWTAGTEYKVFAQKFTPTGSPGTKVKLADYLDGGSDGQGNFYTQTGNNEYYVSPNSNENFYASPGQSVVGGNASAGFAQTISIIPIPVTPTCDAPVPVVTNATSATADISWPAISGATAYQYAVTTSSTPPTSAWSSTTNNFTNATGLTTGITYYFHVRTQCGASTTSPWATISFTALCNAPGTITIGAITSSGIPISWPAVPGSAGYQYAVITNSTPPASGTPIAANSVTVPNLAPGTTYYVYVRNYCGGTAYSNWTIASFITPCPATNPAVSGISANGATFTWTAVAGSGGYQFAVTTSATPPASGTPTGQLTTTNNTLLPGTTYYFHVRTICNAGVFSAWTTITFTTPCPASIQIFLNNITDSTAAISWTAIPGVSGYEYIVTNSSTPPTAGIFTTATSANVSGLTGGSGYYVHVRTKCGTGFSIWTTQPFTTGCIKPEGFVVTTETTMDAATIKWKKINGAVKYEYALMFSVAPIGGSLLSTTDTTLHFADLKPGTKYYLHIRTRCSLIPSAWTVVPFETIGLNIYPSPVSGTMRIQLYGAGNGTINMYDAAGKLVRQSAYNGGTLRIETHSLAAGVYFIRYENGDINYTKKIFKQ